MGKKETFGRGRRTLDPVFNVLDILSGVLQILLYGGSVGVQEVGFRRPAWLHGHSPGAVLDSSSEVALKGILQLVSKGQVS